MICPLTAYPGVQCTKKLYGINRYMGYHQRNGN
jgi:hypothetical protein